MRAAAVEAEQQAALTRAGASSQQTIANLEAEHRLAMNNAQQRFQQETQAQQKAFDEQVGVMRC